jgi:hypothetical protein
MEHSESAEAPAEEIDEPAIAFLAAAVVKHICSKIPFPRHSQVRI